MFKNDFFQIECFDSLGISESKKEFLKNHRFGGVKTILFNTTSFQKDTSDSCGKFVLYFLFERFYNLDIEFKDLLEEIFEKDQNKNELRVEQFFVKIKQNVI